MSAFGGDQRPQPQSLTPVAVPLLDVVPTTGDVPATPLLSLLPILRSLHFVVSCIREIFKVAFLDVFSVSCSASFSCTQWRYLRADRLGNFERGYQ